MTLPDPTAITLTGEDAERFDRIVAKDLIKRNKLIPTPKFEKVAEKIKEYKKCITQSIMVI
jgi:hypothetical protein